MSEELRNICIFAAKIERRQDLFDTNETISTGFNAFHPGLAVLV